MTTTNTTPIRIRRTDLERLEAARRAYGDRTYAETLARLLDLLPAKETK